MLHSSACYNILQDAINHPYAIIQGLRLLQTMMHHKPLLTSTLGQTLLNMEQKLKLFSTTKSLFHTCHSTYILHPSWSDLLRVVQLLRKSWQTYDNNYKGPKIIKFHSHMWVKANLKPHPLSLFQLKGPPL